MKLILKILGEYRQIVDLMPNSKLVKNAVIIELVSNVHGVFEVPEILKNLPQKLLIQCEEYGGGATHTGNAQIICGLSGKPLRPYCVPQRGHLAGGTHALFSVPESVIVVSFSHHRGDGDINIRNFSLRKVGECKFVVDEFEVWTGKPYDLPISFSKYKSAVDAAVQKSNCYHCREPHYIDIAVKK